MNIYRLDVSFEVDDGNDIAWSVDYVTHQQVFNKDEFTTICKRALKRCEDSTMYDLKEALKEDGFLPIKSITAFEFAEE